VAIALREQAQALCSLAQVVAAEQADRWHGKYEAARSAYDGLRERLAARGEDLAQHERLLQRRAQLERELSVIQSTGAEIDEVARKFRETRARLVETHEARWGVRRERAQTLEDQGADVRLSVVAFGDSYDFESQRDAWFGGAGLREEDWEALCAYVFASRGQVPERIAALVDAIRADVETTAARGGSLDPVTSRTGALVGCDEISGHFGNALVKRERIRLDDMERFLPEDYVEASVRKPDGSFKPLNTGSVGEKSTAILSLLLSAGTDPIVVDQPEDDLDNQYVYDVVVDLLRRRKFKRQVIIATHNANIPVNGDAELIVALGVDEDMGVVQVLGSIDRRDVKDRVSVIMEGSAEAFRLRRERYGY
jgi:hypothetical protein